MEKVFHEPTEAARTDGPESEGEKTASIASSVHRVGFSSSVLTARLTQPRAREDRTASALGFSLLAPRGARDLARLPPTNAEAGSLIPGPLASSSAAAPAPTMARHHGWQLPAHTLQVPLDSSSSAYSAWARTVMLRISLRPGWFAVEAAGFPSVAPRKFSCLLLSCGCA
jgi:hypothetical protein